MSIWFALICWPAMAVYRALDWLARGDILYLKGWQLVLLSGAIYGTAAWAIWGR